MIFRFLKKYVLMVAAAVVAGCGGDSGDSGGSGGSVWRCVAVCGGAAVAVAGKKRKTCITAACVTICHSTMKRVLKVKKNDM